MVASSEVGCKFFTSSYLFTPKAFFTKQDDPLMVHPSFGLDMRKT